MDPTTIMAAQPGMTWEQAAAMAGAAADQEKRRQQAALQGFSGADPARYEMQQQALANQVNQRNQVAQKVNQYLQSPGTGVAPPQQLLQQLNLASRSPFASLRPTSGFDKQLDASPLLNAIRGVQ